MGSSDTDPGTALNQIIGFINQVIIGKWNSGLSLRFPLSAFRSVTFGGGTFLWKGHSK